MLCITSLLKCCYKLSFACISKKQCDFVENKTIHHMKYKIRGKMGDAVLKIDINKAYNRIN